MSDKYGHVCCTIFKLTKTFTSLIIKSSIDAYEHNSVLVVYKLCFSYGGNLADLTSRMNNAGSMIEDFFQTGNFKTKCPKIICPFTKATSQPDIRKCNIGSKTFVVAGKEICGEQFLAYMQTITRKMTPYCFIVNQTVWIVN